MLQFVKSAEISSTKYIKFDIDALMFVTSVFKLRCRIHRKYWTVFGAFFINCIMGGYVAVGNFIPYLASYLTVSQMEHNIPSCTKAVQDVYASNTATCNWILTALTLGWSLFGLAGGFLQLYCSTRTIVILGGTIIVLQYLYTWHNATSIYIIILCSFGVSYGMGCGLLFAPSIACVMRWFPENKALFTGILMSALVFGSICYSLIETLYINPNDINNDELCGYSLHSEIVHKIPRTFLLLAAFSAFCTLCSVTIFDKPQFIHPVDTNTNHQVVSEYVYDSCTLKEAMSSIQFWIMFSNVLCNMYVLSFVYSDWKLFAQNYVLIEDDAFLLTLNIAAAICNLCGRIIWGFYYDYFQSYKIAMVTVTALQFIFLISLPMCRHLGNVMLFIWVCVLWFCCSSTYTIVPAALSDTFGNKYCAVLMGFIVLSELMACGLQSATFSVAQYIDAYDKWIAICSANAVSVAMSCCIALRFQTPIWAKQRSINKSFV